MDRLFGGRGYDRRRLLETLFGEWERVIGEREARFVRPLSIEEGVLTVVVPNSTVASEVSFSRERYLERVNAFYGFAAVEDLRVQVAPPESGEAPPRKTTRKDAEEPFRPEDVVLTREELAWVEENAAHVESITARTPLRRALLLFAKRQKWEKHRAPRANP